MTSQCARCKRVFSGLSLFDRHQDVDYDRKPAVACINPVSLGMVEAPNGVWTTPEGLKSIARAIAMGKSRRKASSGNS